MHQLQRQHRRLQALAKELVALTYRPGVPASEIQRSLARFTGTLETHATMEEDALYPALLASPDDVVRSRAERLHRELGPVYGKWRTFTARYPDAESIERSSARFRLDLARILTTLGMRMRREDQQLYPMVERV